jgi:hypothetical protein
MTTDSAARARAMIDSNPYMTLATADESGRPWASPVWFAPVTYQELLWVSDPDARHSRNIAARPQLGIVIFDSRQPMGTGDGVYTSAMADRPTGDDLDRALEAFTRRSLGQGGREWTRADVEGPARLRLYRATASEQFVLGDLDQRTQVTLRSS